MRVILALLVIALAGCGCSTCPTRDQTRAMSVRLDLGDGACTGTAIGPDTILTAQHCWSGKPLKVDGQAVKVTGIGRDKHDALTLRITGHTFKTWARFGPTPKQGDRVHWVGNPAREADVYREGYVARARSSQVLIDAQGFPGDSGSGVFDEQGRLVGVLTGVASWASGAMRLRLIVMYPLDRP